MSTRTWSVDVDGAKHTIVVDYDPQSRRAGIRVDGRLAVKPMSADDSERELQVGSARYVMRRLENDTFELDIPPEVFLNPVAGGRPGQRRPGGGGKQEKSHLGRWIASLVLPLVVIALVRYGRHGFQYMRVPWQPYASPDGAFKAKFPAEPKHEQQTENINGDLWTIQSHHSKYKNHFYAVEYADLKMVVVDANSESVMSRFLEGWSTELGGTVSVKEKTSLLRNPAFNFVMSLPAGAGYGEEKLKVAARMRGVLAIRGQRLFAVWTLSAAADPISNDLQQFIDSFEIGPPPAPATFASINAPPVLEVRRPAPRVETPVTETIDKARLEEEKAARRAAQPQIYLEPLFKMYHVDGCRALTAEMKRVSMEERPFGYAPHTCVPEDVRNWRWKK